MAGQFDEASKQILATLLAEFTDNERTSAELKKAYVGPSPESLATAVCNADDITKVDFEVAFSDLERKRFIKTGPMAMVDNPPGGGIIFIGMYSKKEYVYLTEAGYKEARKRPNIPANRVQRVVNNIHISSSEITNLQLAAGDTISQSMAVSHEDTQDVYQKLIQLLENHGQPQSPENLSDIKNALEQASAGNAGESKSLLSRAFGTTWEKANAVAWPLIAEIVKKSMGF
ncbi:hypothetical protein VRC35_11250 [Erwinia aphidicola]|uniref:hypothetical protein n=1 Tax=Erwinia aphidicola TaxID=68334 RepID=UPI0030D1CEE4